ncbi:SRPBCC family protein [Paramicrobacterium agarici]|uniref:SRPBCC family protein n=1 Tax=Paramicrobacterium agarici TaxID=630514 RepID=UPI000BF8E5FB|nr:SRPBCC family protein [Microbacterium agarici]
MTSTFTLVTRTGAPVEQLFDVSLNIDAHEASMAASGERAIEGVTNGAIGLGETVTWRARHFGIWFTMTSRLTSLERPQRFVDEQVRGPFRSFRHEHTFGTDSGMTVMTDTLTIRSPIFGMLAERLILVPYLRRLIRGRNRHLLASLNATFQ